MIFPKSKKLRTKNQKLESSKDSKEQQTVPFKSIQIQESSVLPCPGRFSKKASGSGNTEGSASARSMHTASCSHVPWPVLVSSPFTQYGTVVTTGCNRMASMRRLRMFSSFLKSTPTHDSLGVILSHTLAISCMSQKSILLYTLRTESVWIYAIFCPYWCFMIYDIYVHLHVDIYDDSSGFRRETSTACFHPCSSVRSVSQDSGLLRVKMYPRTKSIESGTDRPPANSIASKNIEPIKSSLCQCLKHYAQEKRIRWLFHCICSGNHTQNVFKQAKFVNWCKLNQLDRAAESKVTSGYINLI